MSQHQGAMKPAQKRMTGSGGRRETTARRAAENDGREKLLPRERPRVQRRQMNASDGLPLPVAPDVGVRLRGRGRAGGTSPELPLLEPTTSMSRSPALPSLLVLVLLLSSPE